MKKKYGFGFVALVLFIVSMSFGCGSSKVAKQNEAIIESHQTVVVEKTGEDNRPEWTTKETFQEEDGNLIFTGGILGGADYALTLRLAKSEASKNLLESIQIKARQEFSTAIHGQNKSDDDLGRYVTDAMAWTVDNLKIGGINQKEIFYERVFDPTNQSFKYNAWVQLQISRSEYLRAKTVAMKKLVDKAVREEDEEAKEKALELLKKLQREA